MITRHVRRRDLYAILEGELDGSRNRPVEAHLDGCDECRVRLAEVGALMARLGALDDPAGPSRDLWPEIAGRVGSGALRVLPPSAPAAERRARSVDTTRRWGSGHRGRWRALAAATLVVAGGVGIFTTSRRASTADQGASTRELDVTYGPVLARLNRLLAERSRGLEWDLAASAERDLETLRSALEDVRETLRIDGPSPDLLVELEEGYRREVRYLERLISVAGL
jgi:hypothetical protein